MSDSTDGVYNVPYGKEKKVNNQSHRMYWDWIGWQLIVSISWFQVKKRCWLSLGDEVGFFQSFVWKKELSAIENTGLPSVVVLDWATYRTVLDDEDRWPVTSRNTKWLSDSTYGWEGIPDYWPLIRRNLKAKAAGFAEAPSSLQINEFYF